MVPITDTAQESPVLLRSTNCQALMVPVSSRAYDAVIPAFHGCTAGLWHHATTTRKPGATRPTSVSTQ